MLINIFATIAHTGYIAGTGDGLLTVDSKPTSRKIYVLDNKTLALVKTAISLDNGHYLITNLDPTKRYLVMARDYKNEYEPAVWDYVTPATDLSVVEQQELWESWTDTQSMG